MKRIKYLSKRRGASIGFKEYITFLLLGALFIVAIYSFGTGIGESYGTDLTIEDSKMDLTSLESNLEQNVDDSSRWVETFISDKSFSSSNIFAQIGEIMLFSIFGLIRLMIDSINTMVIIFSEMSYNVLGIPPVALGTIISILTIGLIFAGWRLIKVGE